MNRVTSQMRKVLKCALADEFEKLPALMAELNPVQRIDALSKFARYILPSVMPVSYDEGEQEEKEPGIDLSRLTDEELVIINGILGKYEEVQA